MAIRDWPVMVYVYTMHYADYLASEDGGMQCQVSCCLASKTPHSPEKGERGDTVTT